MNNRCRPLGWVLLVTLVLGFSTSAAGVQAEEGREPFRAPELAAAKSLVFPGWGQHGNGQSGKGWAFLAVAGAGALLALETVQLSSSENDSSFQKGVGWSLVGLSLGLGAIDAFVHAGRLNRENGYDLALDSRLPSPSATLVHVSF